GEGQATLFNGRAPLVVRWEGGRQPWPTRVGAETAAAAYQRAVVDAVRETMAPLATQHALSVEQVVAEAFALGRVVLLLDAFDQLAGESARAQEETLRGWLDTPMEPRPKSAQIRVLVTSRDSAVVPHTHPEGHFAFERWAHVRLDGFTERQQLLYLRDLIEQHTGIPTHNPEVWSAALEGRKLKDEWRGPAERIVLTDAECFGAVYATVTELLKVPVLLRFVRDLARDSARFPKFANRADLYFQATNHLFVRNLTLPNVPKVEHDQYIVWFRELLSAVAFQMMCDAPGRYQIEGSVAVSDLKRAAQRRMGDSETQAKWAELFGLSGTVAGLTRYLIVEQSSHSAFGWKHRGMMEFYAGLFLARNTQAGWIPDRSATQSGPADTGLCGDETLRGSVGDPRWEWPFRFAMELSACEDSDARQWVQAPILGASLSTLFEVPQGNRRPTELMWRALSLAYPRRGQWRAYDQWLAGYQSQFESILLEESDLKRATIAAQLVPIDMLEEYRRTGRLTPERFAAIQPGTEPAFVPCPPPGWKHPTEPDRDPCVFWQGSATNAAESYDREKPRHPVRVAPFWMQSTTVTVEQYGLFDLQHAVDFEQSLNSTACEPDCPIIEVDWHDAALFALWVQARLPTESEWEFAARAGRDAADEYFGIPCDGRFDRLTSQQANFNGKYPFGEKQANDRQAYFEATLPVRWTAVRRAALLRQADGPTREKLGKFDAYVANAWALWQMHGNVWEWCADAFVEQAYVNRSRQLLRDCVGDGDRVGKMTPAELTVELERQFRDHLPALRTALQAMISSEQAIEGRLYSAGLSRVLRGGSWNDHGRRLRCAYRNLDHPDARGRGCGFRLCRGSVVRVESSSR
ncbi:MAG: formylglycine-generating enzyme family protein, partial [Planctomycetota bacterium]|nr:formylglycine-generating enzyme family protein [Planctomycetota bacterium]